MCVFSVGERAAPTSPAVVKIPIPVISPKNLSRICEYLLKSASGVNYENALRYIMRPLVSAVLVDSGVPQWMEDFLRSIPPQEICSLAEAATMLRIQRYGGMVVLR